MTVCDACKKEILEVNGFEISIKHKDSVVRYDGCSVECCAKMLHELADQWDHKRVKKEGNPIENICQ